MKIVGYALIAIGLSLMIFFLYNFVQEKDRLVSPLPDEKGVRVIFVTPTK